MDGARFRLNSPPVVHETVAGETIVVNLNSGSYYDLNAVGGYIFDRFELGARTDEVADAVAAAFGIDSRTAADAVESFVARLLDEELIVATGDGEPGPGAPPAAAPGGPFTEPTLNKYTDMQELLLLDPVHEVGEAGWPSRA
jgi:hypothetical protein